MDAQAYIAERTPLVDAWLESFVPPASESPSGLHRAMRHLLFPGGKRLRPAFAMAAAEAVGAQPDVALPVAAAVELIHTYSLIHDDLPCMDDDSVRRGQPTVHVAFDEATAVLAGDALLALAFDAVARIDEPHALPVLRDLTRAAGSRALVGGQADDLARERAGAPLSAAEIESIHERKAAALIAASIAGGARVAGGTEELVARLHSFGIAVGVAFQIVDDRLDRDGLAAVLGHERAGARAEVLLADALASIEDLCARAEPLRELARFCVRRDR